MCARIFKPTWFFEVIENTVAINLAWKLVFDHASFYYFFIIVEQDLVCAYVSLGVGVFKEVEVAAIVSAIW